MHCINDYWLFKGVWDLLTMETKLIVKGALEKGIINVVFSNDGKRFGASGMDDDHCLVVYDVVIF